VYGYALHRAGRHDDAEKALVGIIDDHGESSETLGLLGRVYRDRWEADRDGSPLRADCHLGRAIDAYVRAFHADWRDPYPGIAALILLEVRDPGGATQQGLLPVVRYANNRQVKERDSDYWDHETRLVLGIIARDRDEATAGARAALAAVRESWEPVSTAHGLALIRESRAERGDVVEWADELEHQLLKAAGRG
jgi:hypothetical protein